MNIEQEIVQIIGKLILFALAVAGTALFLFKYLGQKWIENKFAKRLQEFKHDHDKELENLRYRINALLSRVTKIHEIEFQILPEVWLKMQDALGRISGLVNPIQQYPDLNRMGPIVFEEFLAKCKLYEFEKKELLGASDKLSYYQDKMFWHNLRDVEQAFNEFHNYIHRNRIFLSSDLKDQFSKIDDLMWKAIVERKVGQEANDHKMCFDAYEMIRDQINPIRDKIEEIVQKRLRYQEAD